MNTQKHQNKAKISAVVPLNTILESILDLDVEAGPSAQTSLSPIKLGKFVGADTLRYVQRPWIRLLVEVYISNQERHIIQELMESPRIFGFRKESLTPAIHPHAYRPSLIAEFASIVELLARRLAVLERRKYSGSPELLDGLVDELGDDLGCHFEVFRVLWACLMR